MEPDSAFWKRTLLCWNRTVLFWNQTVLFWNQTYIFDRVGWYTFTSQFYCILFWKQTILFWNLRQNILHFSSRVSKKAQSSSTKAWSGSKNAKSCSKKAGSGSKKHSPVPIKKPMIFFSYKNTYCEAIFDLRPKKKSMLKSGNPYMIPEK